MRQLDRFGTVGVLVVGVQTRVQGDGQPTLQAPRCVVGSHLMTAALSLLLFRSSFPNQKITC
jgi:hypothetical protein